VTRTFDYIADTAFAVSPLALRQHMSAVQKSATATRKGC
jgi:hypothetical protein